MSERASSTVELALVIPALLLVIAALGEVALVARTQIEVIGAAREGARMAATSPDTELAVQRVRSALGPRLAPDAVITVSRPSVVGAEAAVQVTVVHRVAAAVLGGTTVRVSGRAVMRVER